MSSKELPDAPRKYRKKPVVVEAVKWDGHNWDDVCLWCPAAKESRGTAIEIPTLEGTMLANAGDWIIKGVKGEFYPCKPDIFEATYEPADGNWSPAVPASRVAELEARLKAAEEENASLREFLDKCEAFLDCEGMASTDTEVAEVIERFIREARG